MTSTKHLFTALAALFLLGGDALAASVTCQSRNNQREECGLRGRGEVVLVRITEQPSRTAQPLGSVTRVLGEHANSKDGAEGVETGRVAREAFLLGPSLTGVLTRMERDGLIERSRCPQDARRTVVRATQLGLSKVAKLSEAIEAHYAWMESELGKQKLAQLYQLLDAVIQLETTPMEEAVEEME